MSGFYKLDGFRFFIFIKIERGIMELLSDTKQNNFLEYCTMAFLTHKYWEQCHNKASIPTYLAVWIEFLCYDAYKNNLCFFVFLYKFQNHLLIYTKNLQGILFAIALNIQINLGMYNLFWKVLTISNISATCLALQSACWPKSFIQIILKNLTDIFLIWQQMKI